MHFNLVTLYCGHIFNRRLIEVRRLTEVWHLLEEARHVAEMDLRDVWFP